MIKKIDYKNRVLHVDVGDENSHLLDSWKRACLGKAGKGGIKDRLILVLQKDLKEMEAMS